MTTTTPTSGAEDLPEALRLAAWLQEGAWNQMRLGDVEAAGRELRRLHALTAQAISTEPAGAGYAELRSSMCYIAAFDPDEVEGMSKERLEGRVRSIINVARSAVASQGQAPAQPVDFTTLGAAMRAIQQAIGLIGDPADERMQAVRRVLRGAVVVAEDSGDIPAQPAPPADSVLYDPKAVLDVFNSARAGSEKPVGYLRGILAVIAHWENRPEPHRWMVPVQAESA